MDNLLIATILGLLILVASMGDRRRADPGGGRGIRARAGKQNEA
jgi:hypothetical protein